MDVITHFAFGGSYEMLEEPDFKLDWKETVIGGSANGVFLRQFPWMWPVLAATPPWLLDYGNPKAAKLVRWQIMVRRQVDEIIEKNRNGKKAEGTIFQAILDSDLPPHEKTAERLQDEAQTVVGAGSETTAKSLSFILFYLMSDRAKLQKLRNELKTVDDFSLAKLEQLPYLVSCPQQYVNGKLTRSRLLVSPKVSG